MLLMTVTLGVLKLSGWLNFFAPCRLGRRACDGGRDVREGVGRRRKRHTRGGFRLKAESQGTGWERTLNTPCMIVTLEVSKLSGLLNFFAFCRARGAGAGARA